MDGAGGASCHLCTATESQIKSLEWVESGFPINRFIKDAHEIFNEVDEEEFLKLPSQQRTGITHQPISKIDNLAACPLQKEAAKMSMLDISLCFQVVYAPNIPSGCRSHTMVAIKF